MSDARFGLGEPYIDIDEMRDAPRPHRYVHGGFADSHTRFSFYFPPKELYRGRFFQNLEGGFGGHETSLTNFGIHDPRQTFDLAFEELGGYLVESNQGHFHDEGVGSNGEVEWFGASAESAKYSKILAAEMYGAAPHHGYVWGASGGGVRTIACMENAPDVYDGGCPNIAGSAGIQQQWSAVGYWWLHCRHKRDAIIEATSPGGSGNPFEGLSHDEAEALATVYRHGYPRGAEAFLWSAIVWMATIGQEMAYYNDFWTKPGYLGHDNPNSLDAIILHRKARVGRVKRLSEAPPEDFMAQVAIASGAPDQQYFIELADSPNDPTLLFGAQLRIVSGAAAGRILTIDTVHGSTIAGSGQTNPLVFDGVEPGDEVEIDNRRFVAWCYLHKHCIQHEDYVVTDPATGAAVMAPEFAGIRAGLLDGRPIHPQSPVLSEGPSYSSGRFSGKMIYVNAVLDSLMWPVGGAAYHRKVREHLGDATDDSFRQWWLENTPHGPGEMLGPMLTPEKNPGVWRSRFARLEGATQQALRDVVRWVEDGVAPPSSTNYRFTEDGGMVLPGDAASRAGVQPLVSLTANGGARAEVKVGEPVRFEGAADSPPDGGALIWAEWDFAGTGTPDEHVVLSGAQRETLGTGHAYSAPGTYFAGLRIGSHRHGHDGKGAAIDNLARVRVVVSG